MDLYLEDSSIKSDISWKFPDDDQAGSKHIADTE
jgi:hypothetical protein